MAVNDTHPGAASPARRLADGVQVMNRVLGPDVAEKVRENFKQMNPDYGRYVIEAGFADVYSRTGLDDATRLLINVAVLTTLGGCEPQLATHIGAALRAGISADQLRELMMHLSLYAGHPRAGNGLAVLHNVLEDADAARA